MKLNETNLNSAGVPSSMLTEKFGLSSKTLKRYVNIGLLPRPKRSGEGNRKGNRNYYPLEAIDILKEIEELKADGWTFKRIKEKIVNNRKRGPRVNRVWVYPEGNFYHPRLVKGGSDNART